MSITKYIRRLLHFVVYGQPMVNNTISDVHIHYSAPNKRLVGKKILITGGAKGLGRAMTERFMQEGANVMITGRDEDALKKVADQTGCHYIKYDITEIHHIQNLICQVDLILDGVNVLVNNAGISLHENDFCDVTEDTFERQIDTNLKGPFFLAQVFAKLLMKNNREGNILFISSETGTTVDLRPYGWAKHIINSMAQGMAYRLGKHHIRVNAICPGVTATDMTGYKTNGNLYCRGTAHRIYLPEEMAEIASFIVSDMANLINGQIIVCNEGNTINARWK